MVEKDSLGHSLEDRCAKCKSAWGKDWPRCQRCGHGTTKAEGEKPGPKK